MLWSTFIVVVVVKVAFSLMENRYWPKDVCSSAMLREKLLFKQSPENE